LGDGEQKEFSNGRRADLAGPPEYVILRKLEYYREGASEKHLTDIANMVEISPEHINFEQLQNKIKDYALEREWQKAQNIIKK